MQHLVIFALDLVIEEVLPSDAVIGDTAGNGCKALSLCTLRVSKETTQSVEHRHTAYIDSVAPDEPVSGAHQRWPVAGLEDGLQISPQADLRNDRILCAPPR